MAPIALGSCCFLGRSENAVRIQILCALIAYLLLALYRKAQGSTQSCSGNCARRCSSGPLWRPQWRDDDVSSTLSYSGSNRSSPCENVPDSSACAGMTVNQRLLSEPRSASRRRRSRARPGPGA
jgi:hypothetical protein